jgi:hypothetical protein
MSCWYSTRRLTHGGGTAGGRVRWTLTAAAAGGNTPTSWRLGQNNKRTGELLGTLGQAGATLVGGASRRRVGFTVSADRRRQWRCGDAVLREEGRRRPFYRRAQGGGGTDLRTKAKGTNPGRGMGSGEGPRRAWAPARVRRRGQRSGGAAGTRGEWGQGEQGGAAQVGGAMARRPADRSRSWRAVQWRVGARRAARRATSRAWTRTPCVGVLYHSTWAC